MEFKYLIAAAGFIFCLIASFALLSFLNNAGWAAGHPRLSRKLPVVFISGVMLAAVLSITSLYPEYYDYISPVGTFAILLPLIAAGILIISNLLINRGVIWFILVAVVATAAVWAVPQLKFLLIPGLSPLCNRLLAIALLLSATFSLRLLNGIPGLALSQVFFIALGIFFLSLFGGLPAQLGIIGLCFSACALAFLIYNWYPPKLNLSDQAADILAFLTGWLILFSSAEAAGSSIFIFAALWICEALVALLKKLTFLKAYADTAANTATYQASLSGLSPAVICNYTARLNIILLLFGCFQIFAPNYYSLPALCMVIIFWQLYRLNNWEDIPDNLQEVNRRFVTDVKSGVDSLKKNLRKDK